MSEAVGHRNLKSTTMVYILCALVDVGFALEISGFLVTDRKFQPLFRPHPFWTYLEGATIALTVLSPCIALLALSKVGSAARERTTARGR
jgi:hypothetical protein